MALSQPVIAAVALALGLHRLPHGSVIETLGVTGMFALLFAASGALFWLAARCQALAA